ncbi:MAG TPA: hypothetical protein VFX92_02050 [Candidatus Krumholzibacteria bacterium]|nr:hypothetical protein [Candidatus Krumholzibacteria bacterium]
MSNARLLCVVLVACLVPALMPAVVSAQVAPPDGARGTVELGIAQEWFHRELEPQPYHDTRWSITSVVFTYNVSDRIGIGVQGGLANFESDDFAGSTFNRFSVGAMGSARVLQLGDWGVGVTARYLDTFDFDTSETSLHKRVRSIAASVELMRGFAVKRLPVGVRLGAVYTNDLVETFAWGSDDALASTSGGALGAMAGGKVRVFPAVSLFGYVNYVEYVQGGVGVAIHAGSGGL